LQTSLDPTSRKLIAAARELAAQVDGLKFSAPVTHVYNPWYTHGKPMKSTCAASAGAANAWYSWG
jgi:hypothetical protein